MHDGITLKELSLSSLQKDPKPKLFLGASRNQVGFWAVLRFGLQGVDSNDGEGSRRTASRLQGFRT